MCVAIIIHREGDMGARYQQTGRPLEQNEGRQEAKTRKLAPPAERLRFAVSQCWLYCGGLEGVPGVRSKEHV